MLRHAVFPVRVLHRQTLHIRSISWTATHLKQYPGDLSTNDKTKTEQYPDDDHSVQKAKKGDTHDIQTSNVKGGLDANRNGTGGHATERRDSAGGVAKAKREHPEAPDPAIGMQDERGSRGT